MGRICVVGSFFFFLSRESSCFCGLGMFGRATKTDITDTCRLDWWHACVRASSIFIILNSIRYKCFELSADFFWGLGIPSLSYVNHDL